MTTHFKHIKFPDLPNGYFWDYGEQTNQHNPISYVALKQRTTQWATENIWWYGVRTLEQPNLIKVIQETVNSMAENLRMHMT